MMRIVSRTNRKFPADHTLLCNLNKNDNFNQNMEQDLALILLLEMKSTSNNIDFMWTKNSKDKIWL